VSEHLLVEEGPVTWLTLNRPERHNAIDTALGDELVEVVTRVGRTPSVKVVVLRGAGRSFCSGDDVSEGAGGRIPDYPWENPYHAPHVEAFGVQRHGYFQLQSLLRRIPQAVICQVQGYCMGSGFDLVLAADFAIADPETKFRFVINATAFLPRYVGLKHSMRLLFSEGFTSAQEAAGLGLITAVAQAGQLEADVRQLAERLADAGEQRYGYMGVVKESVNRALYSTLDEDLRMQLLATRLSDFYRLTHPAAGA
jgi:enoyl-CoA hydratase/carnithine racemase